MALVRGATTVRQAVSEYLASKVPVMVAQARAEWELSDDALPVPVLYDAYEPYALDRWPIIGVNVVQAGGFNRRAYGLDMSQRYLSQYTVRVFTWVRTPFIEPTYDTPVVDNNFKYDELVTPPETTSSTYDETLRLRDDMAGCVRAALLSSGSVGHPESILFDEATLTEEYSEATGVKGDKYVAGVIHSFSIRVDETVLMASMGTADNIVTEAGVIQDGA
jgi:hypothetical protein